MLAAAKEIRRQASQIFQAIAVGIERVPSTIAVTQESFAEAAKAFEAFTRIRLPSPSGLRFAAWLVSQVQAARANPSHKSAAAWLAMGNLTPREVAELLPSLLPDLIAEPLIPRKRGRAPGTGDVTANLVRDLVARIEAGDTRPPTAIARQLLAELGIRGDAKNRADHLVKLLRK